jgi:hypothetical protein
LHVPLESLESLSAECDAQGFTTSVEFPPGLPNATLRVTPSSLLPLGVFEGTVFLQARLRSGELLPKRRMRFSGKIVPDIEAVPPAVQVGGRPLGASFEEVVVLRSLSDQVLRDVRVETQGKGLTIEGAGDDGRYRVRQVVCCTGSQTTIVRFFATVAERQVSIALPVDYTGLQPE